MFLKLDLYATTRMNLSQSCPRINHSTPSRTIFSSPILLWHRSVGYGGLGSRLPTCPMPCNDSDRQGPGFEEKTKGGAQALPLTLDERRKYLFTHQETSTQSWRLVSKHVFFSPHCVILICLVWFRDDVQEYWITISRFRATKRNGIS